MPGRSHRSHDHDLSKQAGSITAVNPQNTTCRAVQQAA
jgi:hypothetical protein